MNFYFNLFITMKERRNSDKIFTQFIDKFYKAAKRRSTEPITQIDLEESINEPSKSIKDDIYAPKDSIYLIQEKLETIDNKNITTKVYALLDGSEEIVEIEEWEE
jgi:hypothetical protein